MPLSIQSYQLFCISSGQVELQWRLDEDKRRLENLKRSFSERLSVLSSLSTNLKTFTESVGVLLPWLQEQSSMGEGLILKDPSYSVIQKQLSTSQVHQNGNDIRMGMEVWKF